MEEVVDDTIDPCDREEARESVAGDEEDRCMMIVVEEDDWFLSHNQQECVTQFNHFGDDEEIHPQKVPSIHCQWMTHDPCERVFVVDVDKLHPCSLESNHAEGCKTQIPEDGEFSHILKNGKIIPCLETPFQIKYHHEIDGCTEDQIVLIPSQ